MNRRPALLLLDVGAVAAFAAIGRSSHAEGLTIAGIATTASPFVAGTVAGWLVTRAWQQPASARTGAVVWLTTVGGGLALRAAAGSPPPLSFAIVTTVVLGVGVNGWRLVARPLLARRGLPRRHAPHDV